MRARAAPSPLRLRIGIDALCVDVGRTGGVETYARQLIAALATLGRGDRVTVFVRRRAAREGWLDGLDVDVSTLPLRRAPLWWWLASQTWLPAAASAHDVDVLHHVGCFASFAHRGPQLVTLHDLISHSFYGADELRRRPARAWLRAAALRRSVAYCRRVLVPSEAVARSAVDEGLASGERIVVTPEAPRPLVAADVHATLARHGLQRARYLLTVSRALPHKNLGNLARAHAAARLPWPLVVVGVADDAPYRERVEGMGVRCLGFVSEDELAALYAGARMFVFVSREEGFGLPPLEAMQLGAPVIVSDIAVHREVCGEAALRCGLAPDEIATALRRLDGDDALRAELAARGRAHAARFSWAATAARTRAAYVAALER